MRELEKRGIGRPSTYASIISTIQDRGYVRLENKRFYAEKMGDIVTQRLQQSFSELLDYGFTASHGGASGRSRRGSAGLARVAGRFYAEFQRTAGNGAGARARWHAAQRPDHDRYSLQHCGRPMQVRTASTGVFLGCSGYALPPKERCKNTLNLTPGDEAIREDADDEAESRLLRSKHRCKLVQYGNGQLSHRRGAQAACLR